MAQPQLRKSSHAVFCIHLHIVLVTKYRRKVINAAILKRLDEIFKDLCKLRNCKPVEMNRESDHVHILVDVSPDNNISELIKILKASSSRLIRKEFAEHIKNFYWKPVFWSSSYFVNSGGGVSLEVLKRYIQSQDSPPVS